MANKNICDVDLLQSMSKNTNVIVDENGKVNKLNLYNEFDNVNKSIDTVNDNIAQISNPNLLINSDFRNPINQRGATSYKAVNWNNIYSIDRFILMGNNFTLSVNDGYITLKTGSEECYFIQHVENLSKQDGFKTLSVNVKNITGNATMYGQYSTIYGEKTLSNGVNTSSCSGKIGSFCICVKPNTTIELYWAKLEQGSIATPLVPRPYGEELALCQRYYNIKYITIGTYITQTNHYALTIPLDCIYDMRTIPTYNWNLMYHNGINIEICVGFSHDPVSVPYIGIKGASGYDLNTYRSICGWLALDAEIY